MTLWIILGVVALIVMFVWATYNKLIQLKNRIQNAWAQINVELKRRYDLIPNLVNTVKGYMKYEKETLEAVIQARNTCIKASSVPEQGAAENQLSGALRQLFALMENYPDLKSNQNVGKMQEELTNTENRIAFSRQFYNDIVLRFNEAIMMFPGNIIASIFGFTKKDYFEVDMNTVQNTPTIDLSFDSSTPLPPSDTDAQTK
ncbi:MAG: LemA family protein [Caldisericia bacterium]|nr:LemA family protein [Caldisericia bacterium]MDD4614047.1 LemA family protein [Caldisericia bacterium]